MGGCGLVLAEDRILRHKGEEIKLNFRNPNLI